MNLYNVCMFDAQALPEALVHRKEQILCQLHAENNRRQQTSDPETKQLIEQAVAFYKKQLKGREKRMVEVVKQCEAFTEKAEIVQSCPGLGPATTAMLLAELPKLGQLNRGEIAKLVGVTPIAKEVARRKGNAQRLPVGRWYARCFTWRHWSQRVTTQD